MTVDTLPTLDRDDLGTVVAMIDGVPHVFISIKRTIDSFEKTVKLVPQYIFEVMYE